MADFTRADLARLIEACLGTQDSVDITEATVDTQFDAMGVDSLARYEIATRLQDELKIAIADDDIDLMATPRQMLDLVNGRLARTGD